MPDTVLSLNTGSRSVSVTAATWDATVNSVSIDFRDVFLLLNLMLKIIKKQNPCL